MKYLTLFFALLLLLTLTARADRFIYKGDTSYVTINSPLEQYPGITSLRKQLAGFESAGCFDCANKPYDAEWTVINNALYLTAIYSDENAKVKLKADINKLFHTDEGRVRADWVTEDIWIPVGKVVRWRDNFPLYNKEYKLTVVLGGVNDSKEFNYPNTHLSADTLDKLIYTSIKWNKVPKLKDEKVMVVLSFIAGASGKPENVAVIKPLDNKLLTDEAIRVFSAIPWSGDYWQGVVHPQSWTFPVIFSEANRQKYTR